MHPLTTSDLAFLLCTSSSSSSTPPNTPLSLSTTYGLTITLFPDAHYLLSPDFSTSTYLWTPNSQILDEWIPADESLLESLYSNPDNILDDNMAKQGSWFDEYLDWVGRAEDQLLAFSGNGKGGCDLMPRESDDSFISIDSPTEDSEEGEREIFQDEGERTLWMVEGVLLAAWLALQEGVEGQRGVYLLEKGGRVSLGEVVGGFLRDVRT
ncbi:hypothetical protein B0T21DRAFT_379093 [Apiosordaria backusii]|uniref:Uncharacterized protein n=1 Tax=Apiosordaria backusii TaxID=314023 RepID=A0AA39ZPN6_9PEZI|nr:hypothetical protein B0T21DRAFT_379093 [Apiosordaria backusii]